MIKTLRSLILRPRLSVVVVVYDMAREARRTLQSLSSEYQRGVTGDEYEVVVVDNGSPTPLTEEVVRQFGRQFRYIYIKDASPSPAGAINTGVAASRSEFLSIMVDGARMLTPGLIANTLSAFRAHADPTIATLGWHLGHEPQFRSIQKGYTKAVEDALLEGIDWPANGYRLFEIACLGGSSKDGCFRPISESNTVSLRRTTFHSLGGYDTRFDIPGGGLVNLDFFNRCCERPDSPLVILPGEGSFHQLHGGASTNIPESELALRFQRWTEQYRSIRGKPWKTPTKEAEYFGPIPRQAYSHIAWSANRSLEMHRDALERSQAAEPGFKSAF